MPIFPPQWSVGASVLVIAGAAIARSNETTVSDTQAFRNAARAAEPGDVIRLAPGRYQGGVLIQELQGEADRPIVIEAADPDDPPVIEGGATGLHLVNPAYVEVKNLVIQGCRGNGLNIDDGGDYSSPAHHVLIQGLVVREIGPEGNRDGVKLSGLDDFRVEDCLLERWGSGGSGIDMVGCHRGEIVDCLFRHGDETGGNGIQAKGGTSEVTVRHCRFEHAGHRAVNLGGSTGLRFFRPPPQGYEAKDLTVEDCLFIGSNAAVAFVGIDGATFRHNTIYRPQRWAFRILQETREPGFVPSRNGQFIKNIIVFRSDELRSAVNVGPETAPGTFNVAENLWYCEDEPARSRPASSIAERGGIYGTPVRFRDPERGDFRLATDSPAIEAGARSEAVLGPIAANP